MKFTSPVNQLKDRGYTFQKMYANDYKCYWKKISNTFTIWLWVKGKEIEINDWYGMTEPILKFYKDNFDSWLKENSKRPKPLNGMFILYNPKTKDVILKDFKEYYTAICQDDPKLIDAYYKKYEGYYEQILNIKTMEKIFSEIKILTK